MSLKQLAFAVLFSGALVAPALAQSNVPPKIGTPTTTTPAPVMSPTTPTQTSTTAPTTTTTTAPVAPKMGMVNINTASAADLDKLPQIGKARSAAIIKARPYKTTDELLTKKVLSKGVFDKIKDKISA